MNHTKKLLAGVPLAALGVLALHSHGARADETRVPPAPSSRPKLAVVVVIDQFRADYLERFRDLFDPRDGAFLRLEREGAVYREANYGHATTYTGPGHAHVLTGSYAYRSGMVGNRWYDRKSGKVVAIAGDPSAHWVGGAGDEGEGTSPRNLIGSTVGDELVLADPRSRVVSIALKSRASILLGGKLGKAYWFNEKTGGFATSTYYAKDLPASVESWNARKLPSSFFGQSWTPCVPEAALARAGEDDLPWEGDLVGLGRTFPHPITGGLARPGEDYFDALTKTPFGNEVELDFARHMIVREGLGAGEATDLVAVSLSANDEVGHTFGPMSREVLDMTVRTDRQLGAFLRWLDENRPGYTLAFTADHGASPIPEAMARLGVEAHRIKKKALKAAIEKALDARFPAVAPVGSAARRDWVVALEDPSVYLDLERIAAQGLDRAAVEAVAAEAVVKVPGIAGAYTRAQLERGENGGTELGRSYQVCFFPERSGDVLLVPAPYSFWGKYAEKDYGDSHGSPYSYDTHVPLAFLGAGVVPGIHRENVAVADLAPTLASLLRVGAPPACEGKVLSGAVR